MIGKRFIERYLINFKISWYCVLHCQQLMAHGPHNIDVCDIARGSWRMMLFFYLIQCKNFPLLSYILLWFFIAREEAC